MIIASAIKYDNQVYFLWPPFRHADVARYMEKTMNLKPRYGEEGFIDDTFTFLNRHEALFDALDSNQVDIETKDIPEDELFSEDLW